MKYSIPAVLVCDHCNKNAPGALSIIECGQAKVQNVVLPTGWVGERIAPTVVRARAPESIDLATTPPARVAAAIGEPVLALWCSADCQKLASGHETMRLVRL